MDKDGIFWAIIMALFSTIITVILIGSFDYWKHHNRLIANMVNDGINPVAAMCAMQDDYGNNPVCVILATQSNMCETNGE